jgi:hypothetical protein
MRTELAIVIISFFLLSCSEPEKHEMLALTNIGIVKDGGSRQLVFSDEAGKTHTFYLLIEPSIPGVQHHDRQFVGLFCGDVQMRKEGMPASLAETQAVCVALKRWHDEHDTPRYRALKGEWDLLVRRLNELIDTENHDKTQGILDRIEVIERAPDWANHVNESKWIHDVILQSRILP